MPSAERSSYNGGLPMYPEVYAEFLRRHVDRYTANGPGTPVPVAATPELTDVVAEFIDTIKKNNIMDFRFALIFRQVNRDEKWAPAGGNYHLHDLDHLQRALTSILSGPPRIYVAKDEHGNEVGEPIGIPIYVLLDLLINTHAAHDLFRMREFNVAVKKVLDGWGKYLKDEHAGSNCTLDTGATGWFGKYGLDGLEQCLRGLSFEETYGVKPEEAQAKYKSWDMFFIREIPNMKKRRPIEVPGLYTPIYNVCESTTFRTAHNVQLDDTFWLKGRNYSLRDMFGGDPQVTEESLSSWAPKFVGGSVYQSFLAPHDYHHWHSPIKGIVLDAAALPGTYYSALPDDGATKGDCGLQEGDPHGALMRSLPWLSMSAARGVIIIAPQDEASPIALVAVIAIGMVEVSTIDICVSKDGASGKPKNLEVGDHMGMFHFGGSSYAIIVKPKDGYEVLFKDVHDRDVLPKHHRWVNEIIGRVVPVRGRQLERA